MYKNILVPVSFEESRNVERAMQVAQALAGEGSKIALLHVMESIPGYAISYLPPEYMKASREAVETEMATMAEGIDGAVGLVISGHSGRSILDYAEENDVDCIIIASHRPGMQDYFLGSTAAQVVRHANCSVHVVR